MTGQADRVKQAATGDYAWDAGDIEVSSVRDLDREGCRFFRATNTAQAGRQPAEYVTLPDGRIIGGQGTDTSRAATLLQSCGAGAPAQWWAQVITRYSGRVGGVVVDPVNAPSAIRKIREAGGDYAPPRLATDAGSTSIVFYAMHYERGMPYEVKATLSDGALSVDARELAPDPDEGGK